MITQDNITVGERLTAPTPKFWKKFATVFGVVAGVAGAVVAFPLSLPATVVTVAGYVLASASAIGITAVSLPVDFDKLNEDKK